MQLATSCPLKPSIPPPSLHFSCMQTWWEFFEHDGTSVSKQEFCFELLCFPLVELGFKDLLFHLEKAQMMHNKKHDYITQWWCITLWMDVHALHYNTNLPHQLYMVCGLCLGDLCDQDPSFVVLSHVTGHTLQICSDVASLCMCELCFDNFFVDNFCRFVYMIIFMLL